MYVCVFHSCHVSSFRTYRHIDSCFGVHVCTLLFCVSYLIYIFSHVRAFYSSCFSEMSSAIYSSTFNIR